MCRSALIAKLVVLTAWVLLPGCTPTFTAVRETIGHAFGPGNNPEPQLDARFAYLRTTVRGRPAYLALGIEEATPGGAVRYWYSADREMLAFQNGRLVGASGLTTEWRKVTLNDAPGWQAAVAAKESIAWRRTRDVMPGYRYGVVDDLSVRQIDAPRGTRLLRVDPAQLTWFEETMTTNVPEAALPPAVYGVDMRGGRAEVVYGEQCVSKELCFTWQVWPVEEPKGTTDERR